MLLLFSEAFIAWGRSPSSFLWVSCCKSHTVEEFSRPAVPHQNLLTVHHVPPDDQRLEAGSADHYREVVEALRQQRLAFQAVVPTELAGAAAEGVNLAVNRQPWSKGES